MNSYGVEGWSELYLGMLGAAAALTGLLFVSLSVNLDRVISYGGIPERGLETLSLLLGAIVLSIFALVPESTDAFAAEVLVLALCQFFAVAMLQSRRYQALEQRFRGRMFLFGAALNQAAAVLMLIGAVSLLAVSGGGMYWLCAALIVTVVAFFANAWILLVEIVR